VTDRGTVEADIERLQAEIVETRAEMADLEAEVVELDRSAATLREVVEQLGGRNRWQRVRAFAWIGLMTFAMGFLWGDELLSWPGALVYGGVILVGAYFAALGSRTYEDKSIQRRFARVTQQLAAVSARQAAVRARVAPEEEMQEEMQEQANGISQRRDRARREG
jgi:chromosome segregation ATPase